VTTEDTPLYVLDSFALLAFFQDEPAAGKVEDLLEKASTGIVRLALSVVNLGEVVYKTIRSYDEERAADVLNMMGGYKIDLFDVDRQLALEAALIKGRHKMSYADCVAAALAQRMSATLVTGDLEFKLIEGWIEIEWLPRRERS